MSKPQAGLQTVEAAARKAWAADPKRKDLPFPKMYVLADRAYYRDTMGKVGVNDVGIYDDAIFIVTPTHFSAWNANTDPSRYGWNAGAEKYMAQLEPGIYDFRRLKHKVNSPNGYMAFGQGGRSVTVARVRENRTVAKREIGVYGINLHRGGVNGTSSEGCQTVLPAQWPEFDRTLAQIIGMDWFPYILIDGPIN